MSARAEHPRRPAAANPAAYEKLIDALAEKAVKDFLADPAAFEADPCYAGKRAATRRTCLYRLFNSDGILLYLGVSYAPGDRKYNHRSKADWFSQVASTTHEWFATRNAALKAELAAIKSERPLHNRQGVRK